MFFNKIAQFNALVSLIHKILWRGSARAEQFSADQSPEAPTSWYLRRAEAVGFEPTGVLPPLVFKTSAFVRSAIPPNGSWDYIRDSTKGSYNVRAKRLLWYAPSPTTTGAGSYRPSRYAPLGLVLGYKLLHGSASRFEQLHRSLLEEI